MAIQTSFRGLGNISALSLGLLGFCPVIASAQNDGPLTKCEDVSAIPVNMMDVKLDDALKVTVPTEIFEVTEDVYAVDIWCGADSSLRPKNDQQVGSGRVVITSSDSFEFNDRLNTIYLDEQGRTTHVITGDLDTMVDTADVYICPNANREMAGWTHGTCQLGILHGDDTEGDLEEGDVPFDCTETEAVEPVAICAYPGSDIKVYPKFARSGFYTDGRPVQYDENGLPIPENQDD